MKLNWPRKVVCSVHQFVTTVINISIIHILLWSKDLNQKCQRIWQKLRKLLHTEQNIIRNFRFNNTQLYFVFNTSCLYLICTHDFPYFLANTFVLSKFLASLTGLKQINMTMLENLSSNSFFPLLVTCKSPKEEKCKPIEFWATNLKIRRAQLKSNSKKANLKIKRHDWRTF